MTGAVVLIRQRRAIEAFLTANAVSAESARSPAELGIREGWPFRRLVTRGVVRRLPDDRCYVDPPGLARYARRLRIIRVTMILLLAVGLAIVAFVR